MGIVLEGEHQGSRGFQAGSLPGLLACILVGVSSGVGGWDTVTNGAGTTENQVCWILKSEEGLRVTA